MTTSELISNVLTFGTLGVELALGVLVWNRRLRPWSCSRGSGCISASTTRFVVGFFSYAILVLYIAFVPPETMDRWLGALSVKVGRIVGPRSALGGSAAGS